MEYISIEYMLSNTTEDIFGILKDDQVNAKYVQSHMITLRGTCVCYAAATS